MTAAPNRNRSGDLPAWRHLLLTLGLIAGSAAAIVFFAVYAWGEIQRVASAFGF
jgi:hypothetical protein